jgi:hypothetical protein
MEIAVPNNAAVPNIKVTIARSTRGASVRISGTPPSLSVDRIRAAIEHQVACNSANRCREPDQTVLERVKCVEARAKRRGDGVGLRLLPQSSLKVDVREADEGFEVSLTGRGASRLASGYTDAELTERLQSALSCAQTNHCDAGSQDPREQLNCVGVGARRRLALH